MFAFVPLYILGLMGATRRLDHYDSSLGWQGLFIVAGIGVMIIGLGIAFQVLQLVVSIVKRKDSLDTTGDPWNGRTLEWSTSSPPPVYNFAVIPQVNGRDAFWAMKQAGSSKAQKPEYEDIIMPNNTGAGIYIAGFVSLFGFSVIWHIWWLAAVSLLGAIVAIIFRLNSDSTEHVIPSAEIKKMEVKRGLTG